uniref:Uncharacterized protein n=1 Tax=Ananas comosus var. bracteatus TaxID=296719 RepID=A0A6V7PTG2_ANACO|nr:unnamed protein product [Ananas comosus var. bracteatus]
MEEFAEADVLWPDRVGDDEDRIVDIDVAPTQPHEARRTASAPIAVFPSKERSDSVVMSFSDTFTCHVIGFGRDEDEGGEESTVPPHIVIAQRFSDKVACSVCTGNGRTLKGRDLFRFRNCVLRMTGFIER